MYKVTNLDNFRGLVLLSGVEVILKHSMGLGLVTIVLKQQKMAENS